MLAERFAKLDNSDIFQRYVCQVYQKCAKILLEKLLHFNCLCRLGDVVDGCGVGPIAAAGTPLSRVRSLLDAPGSLPPR